MTSRDNFSIERIRIKYRLKIDKHKTIQMLGSIENEQLKTSNVELLRDKLLVENLNTQLSSELDCLKTKCNASENEQLKTSNIELLRDKLLVEN